MKKVKYYQNYSLLSVLITIIFILIVVAILLMKATPFYYLILLPLLVVLLQIPIYYTIENEYMIIKRIFWETKVKYGDIHEVKVTQPFILSSMGFLGYIGFTTDGCILLTGNLKQTILVKDDEKNKKYLISPQNIHDFINASKK